MQEQSYLIVPKELLEEISENQKKILALLENGSASPADNHIGNYIPESDAKTLLGKKTTWFWKMRTSGRLPFSKVGSKVFYDRNDIINLLNNNKKNSFS